MINWSENVKIELIKSTFSLIISASFDCLAEYTAPKQKKYIHVIINIQTMLYPTRWPMQSAVYCLIEHAMPKESHKILIIPCISDLISLGKYLSL